MCIVFVPWLLIENMALMPQQEGEELTFELLFNASVSHLSHLILTITCEVAGFNSVLQERQ